MASQNYRLLQNLEHVQHYWLNKLLHDSNISQVLSSFQVIFTDCITYLRVCSFPKLLKASSWIVSFESVNPSLYVISNDSKFFTFWNASAGIERILFLDKSNSVKSACPMKSGTESKPSSLQFAVEFQQVQIVHKSSQFTQHTQLRIWKRNALSLISRVARFGNNVQFRFSMVLHN